MDYAILEDNSQYSSARAILSVALPACLLNAAAPITALVQAGLLGTYVGTDALGAFGAVSITAGFATRVFNFLVDGVSAKTGKSVGLRAWNELGMRVRMSLGFASCAGALASVTLAAIMRPVSVDVLRLSPEVQAEAEGYWWLRVVLVPVLLINMSISGILQGFRHVRTAALLNTGQALLEMVGSTLVLRHNWNIGPFDGLFAMGLVTLVTQTSALITGLICILSMPPPEAAGHFSLWKSLFRREETLNDQSMSLEEPLYGEHMGLLSSAGKSRLIGTASKTKWIGDPRLQDMTESLDSMASTVFPEAASASDELYITIALDGTRQSRKVENGRNDLSTETCHGTSPDEQLDETTTSRVEREIFVQEALPHEQESLLDFVKDGLNMFLRSMILQITFFSTLVAASRLGTASLAAHSVINQLWVLISYAVDGFAAAGIVLGSRLAAQAHFPEHALDAKGHLQRLINRVLMAGLIAGICAGLIFLLQEDFIIALFTTDPSTIDVLKQGTWSVLVASQPINGLVFVYDGLMYASQSFTFIRNYMILGFLLVFCPLLALQAAVVHSLWAVWLANAAINVWRVGGAAYLIHWIFMREFDQQLSAASSYTSFAADEHGTNA